MNTTLIRNGMLMDLDPPRVEMGDLRLDGGIIIDRAPALEPRPHETVLDAASGVVMPGLVNGHTHLYSALACGMPAPPKTPTNFHEILEYVWWRLDRALDEESIRMSGAVGARQAIRCGTTTLIDHHASPGCIAGSLDMLAEGVAMAGPRLATCYEVTDRNGAEGTKAGIEENRRFLARCAGEKSGMHAGLAGAHASFTCSDATLEAVAGLMTDFKIGAHIHLDEDGCDDAISRKQYGAGAFDRLEKFGLLKSGTILGHCIHLAEAEIARLNGIEGVALAHNPRSNMNNAVGYAPLAKFKRPVQLGTDGIGADMFAEAQTAWFKSRDGGAGLSPDDIVVMLANSARRASQAFGIKLGKLEIGAAADVVVTDYCPSTHLESGSVAGHLIFAMGSRVVKDVFIAGKCAMRDRVLQHSDEDVLKFQSRLAARQLWDRMSAL